MKFTNRQLRILSYISNHPAGIHGAELSKMVKISLRTLQTEVRAINKTLPSGEAVISSRGHGYQVCISPQTQESIRNQLTQRHTIVMPQERLNYILMILMFERDYVSMEYLAERLYVSKATIYKDFKNIPTLQKYVEISKTHGVKIKLSESIQRGCLAEVFDQEAAGLIEPTLQEEIKTYNEVLQSVLPPLAEHGLPHISGIAMRRFRHYMVMVLIRIKRGFIVENTSDIPISDTVLRLVDCLQQVLEVHFSADDIKWCQQKLNGLNVFYEGLEQIEPHTLIQYEASMALFQQRLSTEYGVDFQLPDSIKQQFYLHLHQYAIRHSNGHGGSNYLKREINRSYTMCVHLILELFTPCFHLEISPSDACYLALYLASGLYRPRTPLATSLISEQHPSVLNLTVHLLHSHFGDLLTPIRIIPDYIHPLPMENTEHQLILTTKQSIALSISNAVLIQALLRDEDYYNIEAKINCLVRAREEDAFQQALLRYVNTPIEVCTTAYPSPQDFLKEKGFSEPFRHEFVLDSNSILYPKIHNGTGKNEIRLFIFSAPLLYRGMTIRLLVVSDYYTQTMEIQEFYSCVQKILSSDSWKQIFQIE